jgi:zinc/manganese transport system substrate-binding protein
MIKLFYRYLLVFAVVATSFSAEAVNKKLIALPKPEVKKLQVIASFSIIGDMVKQVGGDKVEVTTLVGPNGDVHLFEPSPEDAKNIANADIIFVNGLGMEGWLDRLISSSGYDGQVVELAKNVKTINISEKKDDKPAVADPHAWQDISNGKIYIDNIRNALVKRDKKNAKVYEQNAQKYIVRLSDLNSWVKNEINKVPSGKRKVITSHDSFRYFAEAYDIEFFAPQGISSDSQPSAGDMAKLEDQMLRKEIKAVFFENMTDQRLTRQLEKDVGAKIGGVLYSDALSEPTGPAGTYFDMFKNNVPKLVTAMKGNP